MKINYMSSETSYKSPRPALTPCSLPREMLLNGLEPPRSMKVNIRGGGERAPETHLMILFNNETMVVGG